MRLCLLATLPMWLSLATGCFSMDLDEDPQGESAVEEDARPRETPPPESCRLPEDTWAQVRALHDETERSVHELIKCGGLQTSISRTFLVVLVASNRDLFDEQAYADLVQFARGYGVELSIPFSQGDLGRWTLPLPQGTGSEFSLVFYDPASGDVIEHDPFTMDTYLEGVTAETVHSIDEMKNDLTLRNRITFTWEATGELSSILNGGREIPNPFTVDVSFADLAEYLWGIDLAAGDPDFGPLDSVWDLRVESEVRLNDDRGDAHIEYEVDGLRATLREIAQSGVRFDVRRIVAGNGEATLEGITRQVRYDPATGGLTGHFEYRVESPDGPLHVTDTYGGTRGFETRWSCAGGE